MINVFLILSLVSTMLSGVNCSSGKGDVTAGSSYLPLKQGSFWAYNVEGSDSVSYRMEVLNVSKDGSDVTANVNLFPMFYMTEEKRTLRYKDNGEIVLINNDEVMNIFPALDSVKKGHAWNMGLWYANIVSTDEKVVTPSGTYNDCVHVNYALSITFGAEIWFKKGVGIVKWIFNRTNPPALKFSYYTLSDHSVK